MSKCHENIVSFVFDHPSICSAKEAAFGLRPLFLTIRSETTKNQILEIVKFEKMVTNLDFNLSQEKSGRKAALLRI